MGVWSTGLFIAICAGLMGAGVWWAGRTRALHIHNEMVERELEASKREVDAIFGKTSRRMREYDGSYDLPADWRERLNADVQTDDADVRADEDVDAETSPGGRVCLRSADDSGQEGPGGGGREAVQAAPSDGVGSPGAPGSEQDAPASPDLPAGDGPTGDGVGQAGGTGGSADDLNRPLLTYVDEHGEPITHERAVENFYRNATDGDRRESDLNRGRRRGWGGV